MASVHVEASALSSHEANLGFCKPQEWRKPGQQTPLFSSVCTVVFTGNKTDHFMLHHIIRFK